MRRGVILVPVALFLAWLYVYALSLAIEFAARERVPIGWSHLFQTPQSGLLPWMFLLHTIAVTAASVPFAFVIVRIYPRYWLLVALMATAPLYFATTLPMVVQNFGSSSLRLQITDILDAVTLVGILPLLTWGLRNLPSNMRWSGRAVQLGR